MSSKKKSPKSKTHVENSNNSKKTPKRPLQSPESIQNDNKKQNTMNDQVLTALNKLQAGQDTITSKIDAISADIRALQTKQNSMDVRLDGVEKKVAENQEGFGNVAHLENKIAQMALARCITAFGIPSTYHNKRAELVDTLNRALDMRLSINSFRRINTFSPNADQCSAILEFTEASDKMKFMDAINALSRDHQGKWHPLTVEDIFEEVKNPPSNLCGRSITFMNTLTKLNQSMIRLKKEVQPVLLSQQDGVIYMRKDISSKRIEAKSVSHIKQFVEQCKNN